jgi:AAA domain
MVCPEIEISDPQVPQDVQQLQISQDLDILRASVQEALSRNWAILLPQPNFQKPLNQYSPNGVNSAPTTPPTALPEVSKTEKKAEATLVSPVIPERNLDLSEDVDAHVVTDVKAEELPKRSVRDEVSFGRKRMSYAEMVAEAERDSNSIPIVKDLIFRKTVNIGIGDSGLGKTPFFVQLALCVAFGLPFMGQECQRGKVLIADYENHAGLVEMLTAVAKCLGIQTIDENWLAVIRDADQKTLAREIEEFRPLLVIVDSLRGYNPSAEEKSHSAAGMIAHCQKIAERDDCAWMFIHHLRKQNKSLKGAERPDLFNTDLPVTDWLQEGAGFLALINQSFTRIGFAKPKKEQNSELGLRASVKGRGEVGPLFLDREYDESGEPIGYKRLFGSDLLTDADRKLLKLLPANEPLPFGKVLDICGGNTKRPFVGKFLHRCIDAGVVKTGGKDSTISKTYMRVEGV